MLTLRPKAIVASSLCALALSASVHAQQNFEIRYQMEGVKPRIEWQLPNISALPDAAPSQPYQYSFSLNPANPITDWEVSGLPDWLSFDANTRTFIGTPGTADVGTATITLAAKNKYQEETERYQLKVTPPSLASCNAHYAAGERSDGTYRIKPSGASTAFNAYCDMRSDGGWTRIGSRSYNSSASASNTVILNLSVPTIPSYSSVRQPSFVIYDCSSCSANSWTVWDEKGLKLTSGGSRSMNGSTSYTAYSSSSRLIYKASWSGMSGGSRDGIGVSGAVYVK